MIVEVKDMTMNTHSHTQSNQRTPHDDDIVDGPRIVYRYITTRFTKDKDKVRLWEQSAFMPNHDN